MAPFFKISFQRPYDLLIAPWGQPISPILGTADLVTSDSSTPAHNMTYELSALIDAWFYLFVRQENYLQATIFSIQVELSKLRNKKPIIYGPQPK